MKRLMLGLVLSLGFGGAAFADACCDGGPCCIAQLPCCDA